MRYIKINKPSLDYNQFADFHAFTMNNLVRNVMRKGKYKKAVKIVRLGLLHGLKELFEMLSLTNEPIVRTYRPFARTYLRQNTKNNYILKLAERRIEEAKEKEAYLDLTFDELNQQLLDKFTRVETFKYSHDEIINSYLTSSNLNSFSGIRTPKIYNRIECFLDNQRITLFNKYMQLKELAKTNIDNALKIAQFNQESFQYHKLDQLKFIKLYTKKQHTIYSGIRDLTVFDMVLQVYSMLTGAWYMRKSKVSGRTILIPSPLRPYRRIVNVTKMLLKGIRKRRHQRRSKKNAMIDAFGIEFCWLLFYNGFQYKPTSNFANCMVWDEKIASHKELVANLKNIKYLKYF